MDSYRVARRWPSLLGALVASLLLLATGSPPHGAIASADQPVVVLFVEGLNSDSSDGGATFAQLWSAVQTLQPNSQRAMFSYRGGSLDDEGTWAPESYTACDTQQTLSTSLDALDQTIQQLRGRWPDAKLVVVGHSLGGFLAMAWLSNAAATGVPAALLPDVVISVDSPLRGLVPEQVAIGWRNGPPIGCASPTVQFELVRYRTEGWDTALAAGLVSAVALQRLVIMIGNDSDIAFACCPGIADGQHVDVPGTISWKFNALEPDLPGLEPGPFSSHHAPLFNAYVVRLMAGAIVTF